MAKLLTDKKLFLLDQDGTLYNGDTLFKGTIPFLKRIKDNGGRFVFVTNNTSTSVEDYIKKLNNFGINAAKTDFFTATEATVFYLKTHHPNQKIYVLGTTSFVKALTDEGILVTTNIDDAEVALLSYDRELTYPKLVNFTKLLTLKDVPYLATNPDFVCPIEFGFVPDCGSFAIMLEKATGKTPFFIGKPNATFFELALEKFGYTKEETVMIGDRLYTDILGALNAKITAVCVLTGEATSEDIKNSPYKPDIIVNSIDDLL